MSEDTPHADPKTPAPIREVCPIKTKAVDQIVDELLKRDEKQSA
jgi:hypothetical protein